MKALGAVMAGGLNTRYGGLKAFATVGDRQIVRRVVDVLNSVTDEVVVIANDHEAYQSLGLPMRADVVAAKGALGGLLTALRWSEEKGFAGVLAVACDMPFASRELAREIMLLAEQDAADVIAPESGNRRGLEPLFAFYSNACIPAIDAAIARDDQRMIGFHGDVRVLRIAIDDVRRHGDPQVLFMNVNTPDELTEAQRIEAASR